MIMGKLFIIGAVMLPMAWTAVASTLATLIRSMVGLQSNANLSSPSLDKDT